LKQLEADGLISREEVNGTAVRVEYALTDFGKSVLPLLNLICGWGTQFTEGEPLEKKGFTKGR